MSAFMVPRFIQIVSELPKTPTQKVRKDVLRSGGVPGDVWDSNKQGGGNGR
jgi:crotonobetaine/carnitine-CoA ligase